ncbi:MAG: ArsR family transcriptional regulator [Promethearchaeota archaeon]|nr:MAG: ArsR family transcriptional regulator [Candidatus Lokiarchaeota archaeon]
MKNLDKNSSSEQKNELLNAFNFVDLVISDLKMKILLNLLIAEELSLTQITNKLDKSKPTIHRHLKKLIKNKVVEVSKEKKVRGSIKAKYYKLADDFQASINPYRRSILSKIHDFDTEDIDIEEVVKLIRFYILIILKPLKTLNQILDSNEKDGFGRKYRINTLIKNLEPSLEVMFFSEKQHEEILELLNSFYSRLKEIIKDDDENNTEKPYYLSFFTLKLKELLELENRI